MSSLQRGRRRWNKLKSAISTISRYILETVQDGEIVTVEG